MKAGEPIQKKDLRALLYKAACANSQDAINVINQAADVIIDQINENYTLIEAEEEPQEQTGE